MMMMEHCVQIQENQEIDDKQQKSRSKYINSHFRDMFSSVVLLLFFLLPFLSPSLSLSP